MKKVVIIGGGMTSLLCSYIFKKYGVEATVIDPDFAGCDFMNGGLQFVYHTRPIEIIFDELDLCYSDYSITGGILLRGNVKKYPSYFKKAAKEEVARVKSDYYRKTRLVSSAHDIKKAVPDLPDTKRPRRAIRVDFEEFSSRLARESNIVKTRLLHINDNAVSTTKGRFEFDHLVCTLPLWSLRPFVSWRIPHCCAMRLNTISVETVRDSYLKYDYVLTPYTPANHVHRFYAHEDGYMVEVNGQLNANRLRSDLNFIFDRGWYARDVVANLNGFLLPIEEAVQWPGRCVPLGKFAKWDQKITLDVTLNEAIELARKWFK